MPCPLGKSKCDCAYKLRRQLGLKRSQALSRAQLTRIERVAVGDTFQLFGGTHHMTGLMKTRVKFAREAS